MLTKKASYRTACLSSLYLSLVLLSTAPVSAEMPDTTKEPTAPPKNFKPAIPKQHKLLQPGEIGYVQDIKEAPKDFPIPLPLKYQIFSVHESANANNKRTVRVCFNTKDTPDKVYQWYKDSLPGDGWKIKERSDKIRTGKLPTIDITKGQISGHITFITFDKKGFGTSIIAIAVGMNK